MSISRILLSCAIALPLLAQRSDTIFSLAVAGATAPTKSGTLRNIGQSGHILWVQLAGVTCPSPAAVDIYLEASFDAQVWAPAGARITQVTVDASGSRVASAVAQGAFPHIRVSVDAVQSGCSATVYYSGTVGGQGIINLAHGGQFPQYYAPAPTTTETVWGSGVSCITLLEVSSESGILGPIAVRATTGLSNLMSYYLILQKSIDGGSWNPIVPLYTSSAGAASWSDPMRALGTGSSIIVNSGALVPEATNYSTSAAVRVCSIPALPVGQDPFNILFSVYRRVQSN